MKMETNVKTNKKELNVIHVPASGVKQWGGGAYCITFVYSKLKGNFILKGYYEEVRNYLKQNYTHYFVNYTMWSEFGFRSTWTFWKDGWYIRQPDRQRTRPCSYHEAIPKYKWELMNFGVDKKFKFRRFPKRWIKLFDEL